MEQAVMRHIDSIVARQAQMHKVCERTSNANTAKTTMDEREGVPAIAASAGEADQGTTPHPLMWTIIRTS